MTGGEIGARPLAPSAITNTPPLLGSLILPFVAVPAPLPPHQAPNVAFYTFTAGKNSNSWMYDMKDVLAAISE